MMFKVLVAVIAQSSNPPRSGAKFAPDGVKDNGEAWRAPGPLHPADDDHGVFELHDECSRLRRPADDDHGVFKLDEESSRLRRPADDDHDVFELDDECRRPDSPWAGTPTISAASGAVGGTWLSAVLSCSDVTPPPRASSSSYPSSAVANTVLESQWRGADSSTLCSDVIPPCPPSAVSNTELETQWRRTDTNFAVQVPKYSKPKNNTGQCYSNSSA